MQLHICFEPTPCDVTYKPHSFPENDIAEHPTKVYLELSAETAKESYLFLLRLGLLLNSCRHRLDGSDCIFSGNREGSLGVLCALSLAYPFSQCLSVLMDAFEIKALLLRYLTYTPSPHLLTLGTCEPLKSALCRFGTFYQFL